MPTPQLRACLALACLFLALLGAHAQSIYSTPYSFSTFAGTNSIGTADGQGSAARFYQPDGAASDANGNLYLSDSQNHIIRKISPSGTVTTLAGLAGIKGSSDGSGSAARFNFPRGLAMDASGNIFVADSGNRTIRKITPAGEVTTFAGLAGEQGITDGVGNNARFRYPLGLTMSIDGNLYVADDSGDDFVDHDKPEALESLIRKITPSGTVTTFATGLSKSTYHSSGTYFKDPFRAITSDANGNIIVASTTDVTQVESNLIRVDQAIVKFSPNGTETTLLQITATIYRGPASPSTPRGEVGFISDLLVDRSGNLLVAETKQISKFDLATLPAPTETVLISAFVPAAVSQSPALGPLLRLAADRNGNLLIVDSLENSVHRLSPASVLNTLAGIPAAETYRSADGTGTSARFKSPNGLCTDAAGNLYVADYADHVIRKITSTGAATTIAGLAGSSGNTNGTGSAARFYYPSGIAVDATGIVYVADTMNRVIRRITPAGEVSNLAGSGSNEIQDGPAASASFYASTDLTIDSTGNLYVIDNDTIRKIAVSGNVTTLAGKQSMPAYANGIGSDARFYNPSGLVADATGNIYVADSGNHAIRKISPTGVVTTLAGGPSLAGSADGSSSVAGFLNPTDLSIDAKGDLFVVDSGNNTIRIIASSGEVSTVAGLAGINTNTDGLGAGARFNSPNQIAVDSKGNLFVGNHTAILKGQLAGPPIISSQPQNQTVISGNSVQLSVIAGGVPSPTYQWFFNGSAFAGATTNALAFTNARSTDAGDYTVVVTNSLGSVTSNKATLTVSAAPTAPTTLPASGGASGGGSISAWFVLTLLPLLLIRRLT